MKNIILSESAGFCFGVKRAVESALKIKQKYNKKIYTLGPLIHNNDVVSYLKANDIFSIDIEQIEDLEAQDVVIIRSHGVSKDIYDKLTEKNIIIEDATCPYVSNIQKKVNNYYQSGYNIIIVGDKEHPEVVGINGWCENKAIISKDGSDLEDLPYKVCVVSQTTEKQENWEKVLNKIAKKSKEILAINTICSATDVRQKNAEKLSKEVDAMVVLGGYNSSNTTKLYEICKKNCENTFHIENANELPSILLNTKNITSIGVTAGASTPDWIIKEAISKMSEENLIQTNEQLVYMEQNDKQISVGDVIKGEVISLNENEAFLNIGYKADGLLPKYEVTRDEKIKLNDVLNLGDIVEVKVISRRNEDGYVVLSRIEIERQEAYKIVKEAFENKQVVTVTIKDAVNGGLVASLNGVRLFIPASHIELSHVEDLTQYIGTTMDVNIIEIKEDRKFTRIVASRRDLLKVVKDKEIEEVWAKLEKDVVLEGIVRRTTNFGAFIDIDGVDGLLHVSEISWGRVNRPGDALKLGQKVTVKVIEIDKENKKLSLSMKALVENPWTNVEEKYPAGNIVLGKVVRFAEFGAFIELEPGVDALVHVSEISHKRVEKPADVLTLGSQVKAKILDVNKENKKIGLSIKAVEEI
jgi:4-hydroxy-3-methylbut-2-enyl diphosphate reductase